MISREREQDSSDARVHASNREVIAREARREMKEELSELPPPEKPAPIIQRAAPARTRRVLRSNYLG